MNCAAWFDLQNDNIIADHPTALRVYARLMRLQNIYFRPQDVKGTGLAIELHVKPESVFRAITLLIERGYVIDHGRSLNNVRRLTLAIERVTRPSNGTTPPAA